MPFERSFDVYGYRFRLQSSGEEILEGLSEDFAFFSSTTPGEHTIELLDEDPPVEGLPRTDGVVYTPRNVVYDSGTLRYIDYHGRGLGIQDRATGSLKIYSRDKGLLYEAAYLYLLSRIGEYLDERGLHRIHALGLAIENRAVLVLLPMGGGKSTLGLHLLKYPGVRLLSDDSPFLNRRGAALAYPLRLGLLPGAEQSIPASSRRLINRMEFGPKHLVNYSYFKEKVQPSAEPGLLFIGARTLAPDCRIEEIGRMAGLRGCIANCAVGVGLFQGLEFVLQASPWELLKKAGLGVSRLRNCYQFLRHAKVCRIHLGRDQELNARTLLDYSVQQLGMIKRDPSPVSGPAVQEQDARY
jgi:hypothetical protein